MALAASSRIGPYEVQSLLGAGGMGEVYKARDTRLNRTVALKVLRADRAGAPEQQDRFLQEARAASALQHPHIITVHDVLTADGALVIVLEHVAGKTLDQVIPKKGLRVNEALRLAVQIADALAAAHAAGIIHRDLKPSNVMVTEQGSVKLLDFGLAKLSERASAVYPEEAPTEVLQTKPVTGRGVIMGTLSYMSPEQAEGKPVDARSDIFSFGCVLYEMVTGQRAFRGDSAASTISAILRDDPAAPASLSPDVPRELERIVQRCLRKDPARRWQTMGDLRVALEDLKEESESGKLPLAAAAVAPRRSRTGWIAAAGALVVVAAGGAWFATGRATRPVALEAVPLTSNPGHESHPSFSPDGAQVAYAWTSPKQDNSDIYVKLVGAGEPLRLTTDRAPSFAPAWSPDGRQVAFIRRAGPARNALMLVAALGGGERKVVEYDAPARNSNRQLAWSPDGKWLITTVGMSDGRTAGVTAFSLDNGAARQITAPPAAAVNGDLSADLSPDGSTLIFGRTASAITADLYLLPLRPDMTPGGEAKRLTGGGGYIAQGAWSADGRTIVFGLYRSGGATLWRMRAEPGAAAEQLPVGVGDGPAISRKGNRLAFVRSEQDSNILRVDIPPAGVAPAAPSPVISWTSQDGSPDISPDGKRLAFSSFRSGAMEVWTAESDGSHPVQLTKYGQFSGSPRWSPNGLQIAFDSNDSGQFEIYLGRADGGAAQRLTPGSTANAIPVWSRDGRWIYFSSLRTGTFEIWKMRPDGSEAQQLTRHGGRMCSESPDGRWLYYTKTDNRGPLWRMPSTGGPEELVLDVKIFWRSFAVGSTGIYDTEIEGNRARIAYHDLASRASRTIVDIDKPLNLGFALSPDEKYVLFTQLDREGSNIMVVDNFR